MIAFADGKRSCVLTAGAGRRRAGRLRRLLQRVIVLPLVVCFGVMAMLSGCAWAEIEAPFAPGADPWARWAVHDDTSTEAIDHGAYDRLLSTYIVADGSLNRFAYGRVTPADRQALADYVGSLERINITAYSRREQFAFWVNLYNAATLKLVLDHYPIASIRDIKDGMFSAGPWDRKLVVVDGQELSLNDIEHHILRPLWKDPRAHYVLNCASVGCPNLQAKAFTGASLDRQLQSGAHDFINSPRGVRFEAGNRLVVSSIYAWYREDFGGSEASVIEHLKIYAQPALRQRLSDRSAIDGFAYDWALNDI